MVCTDDHHGPKPSRVGERVGYLARPDRRAAGVLLLPSVHGVDPSTKAYAQALAEAGLATLIWEPFPASRRPRPASSARRGWRR